MILDFKTTIKDADISYIEKLLQLSKNACVDANTSTIRIEYYLEFETREWGIKGVTITIKKVTTTIEWEVNYDDLTDDEQKRLTKEFGATNGGHGKMEGIIEIDSTQTLNGKAWTIDGDDVNFEKDGAFSITSADFDFDNMIIILS